MQNAIVTRKVQTRGGFVYKASLGSLICKIPDSSTLSDDDLHESAACTLLAMTGKSPVGLVVGILSETERVFVRPSSPPGPMSEEPLTQVASI
jgi:hypothetical protein